MALSYRLKGCWWLSFAYATVVGAFYLKAASLIATVAKPQEAEVECGSGG
jgi:hypothetical protein